MLSLRMQEQFPGAAIAPEQRWLRGAALSLAVHVIGITAIVVQARQAARWQAAPAGIDLARSAGDGNPVGLPEAVTVDLAAPLTAASMATLPPLDLDGIEVQRQALPARGPGRAAVPTPGAALPARGGRAGKVALSEPAGLAAPAPLPLPGAEVVTEADPARAAFRAQLRRHLHEAWHANEVFARIDPQGRLDGSLFTTAIQVRLHPDGTIDRAELAESSGIAPLDKEALGSLGRMEPLPPVPASMLDVAGGWNVLCKFYLDVGLFRFAADIRRVISEMWHPSRAFGTTATEERKTVVRLLLKADGTLVSAEVVGSAGVDFLDANALTAVRPGAHLPVPPRAFMRQPGPANVFVAFLHQAGDVRVLKPREDVEDQ